MKLIAKSAMQGLRDIASCKECREQDQIEADKFA
jgi:hypothetical protein